MSRKRVLPLFLVLVFATLTATASWIASSAIKSPAEVAARTAPPTPSPILVPVEKRMLTSQIITRGTARFVLPQSVSIAPTTLKTRSGVVSAVKERGSQLREGDVLLTASGRPVFALQGDIPVYRDLVPGISGDDVRQLEAALKRRGFDPDPVDGTFDENTSAAVASWYVSAGWTPFGPTHQQLSKIRALEEELASMRNRGLAAAAAAAPLAIDAARARARSANKVAAAKLTVRTSAWSQLIANPRATDDQRKSAKADLKVYKAAAIATRLEGELAIQAAVDAQKAAEREASLAEKMAARLAADLEATKRRTGVQVPADEVLFITALPVRVEETRVAVGDAALGPVITVTTNEIVIDSSLRLDEAPFVKPGMSVKIDEPALGIEAKGVVQRVAASPGTDGVDGYHIYFETLVTEANRALEGFSLRLKIPVQSTAGEVTAVPVSAISLAADGTSRVQVDIHGGLKFLVVKPGLSANGFVEITALEGVLEPGQLVVVGHEKNDDTRE